MILSSAPDSRRAIRLALSRLARGGGLAARLALALPLVGGVLLVVQAGLLAHVLHQAIADGLGPVTLAPTIVWFASVLGIRIGLGFVGELGATRSSETIKLKLRRTIVDAIFRHQPTWTGARSSGALSGAVIEQVEAIDGYLTRYLPAMAQAAILPMAFAVVVLPIDWTVALLFLVTAPLIPVFMALAGWGAEAASNEQAQAIGRLSGHFADRLRGLTTLKLFGREAAETEGVRRASEQLRLRTMRVMRIAFLSSAVLEFFAALGVAGVALYVGLTFLDLVSLRGGVPLSLEAGLFCLLMAPEVYQPLRLLAANYHDQASAKAAMAEIVMQLGEVPLETSVALEPELARTTAGTPGTLRLAHVSIDAPDGRPVVTEVSLELEPGEHVAIVGVSGCGKSTLIEAIAGLREFRGEIVVPGPLGMVGQRPTIFAGSIADNIRLGQRNASQTALRLAARRAHVTDFVDELPDGIDTQLGENGLGLSGGEIHRVALARLYLRVSQVLLLDEPTAHLDAVTEAAVLDDLVDFARGRTMIVVTHSPAVAARMDRSFCLVDGRLLPEASTRINPARSRSAA
ncbi:MAG: thiol reductant ABC exporter subunit CydD [Devosia sp.]